MINGKTRIYCILGNPVGHSLSPVMHNAAFAELGLNAVYVPFRVEDPRAALQAMKTLGIGGASVTIPHKEQLFDVLDRVDPLAGRIGAVNTVVVEEIGGQPRLFGTNTDWLGSNRALAERMTLAGSRVLILGAGGAARAIGYGLLEAGAQVGICSRSPERGQLLAEQLGCPWFPLDRPPSEEWHALVNATSVGMAPKAGESPVPIEWLARFGVVMDIVYAPLATCLLKEAAAAGCRCIDGLEMLLYQGAAQFELWTGKVAPVAVMRHALLAATGNLNNS